MIFVHHVNKKLDNYQDTWYLTRTTVIDISFKTNWYNVGTVTMLQPAKGMRKMFPPDLRKRLLFSKHKYSSFITRIYNLKILLK